MRSRSLLFVVLAIAVGVALLVVLLLRADTPPVEIAPGKTTASGEIVQDVHDTRPDTRLAVPTPGTEHQQDSEPNDTKRAPGELPHDELHPGWMRPVLCVVDGNVHRPDGSLVGAGVQVKLALANQNDVSAESKTRTDAEGHFRCERLEPWRLVSVRATESGFAPAHAEPNLWLTTERIEHVDVTLGRAASVDVLVVDRLTQKPVSKLAVRAAGPLEPSGVRQIGSVTEDDGHAHIDSVPVLDTFIEGGVEEALFEFTLASTGWLLRTPKVSAPKPAEGKPYDLRLEVVTALARIQGEVVRGPENTPCPKATIYFCHGREFQASIADDRGHFVLENMLAGSVRLIARATITDGTRQAGWYATQEFELKPGDNFCRLEAARIDAHPILGHVRYQDGRPADAVQVRAWRTEGDVTALREGPLTTMSAADGHYSLLLMAPSNYVVEIGSTPEHALLRSTPQSRTLQLDPHVETKDIDFELADGIVLAGRVERAGSKAELAVLLAPLDQPGDWTEIEVAADSSFSAGPLVPGHYRLMLSSGGPTLDLVHAGPGTVKDIVLRAKP